MAKKRAHLLGCPCVAARVHMKRLFVMAMAGPFALSMAFSDLYAQSVREARVAVTLGVSGGDFGQVGAMATAFGVSMRIWGTTHFTGRLTGGYATPFTTGSRVCVDSPCDTRRFREEWRVGTDVRRALGPTALFAHAGVGISSSRVTGEASQLWEEWGKGDRRTSLGFGQIGIGVRSREARHARWLEAGVERQAGAANEIGYLRAGLSIL
ncbi:MAG: hypothetical protein ACYC5V_03655 [Gemmatimonadaceae bacterium]